MAWGRNISQLNHRQIPLYFFSNNSISIELVSTQSAPVSPLSKNSWLIETGRGYIASTHPTCVRDL